jgi:hypothetical protein
VTPDPFQYATLRVVPRLDREEFINVGVIVFCRTRGFLQAEVRLDLARLQSLAPVSDPDALSAALQARVRIAAGNDSAGPVAALPQSERFHWLVAPSSTMIQTSAVHSGLCEDPGETLRSLFASLVSS